MAELACDVTFIDQNGKRWTVAVTSTSVNRAVYAYNNEVVAGILRGQDYPRLTLNPDVPIEVKTADGRIFHTSSRKVMEWGNRLAEKQSAEQDRRKGRR